MLKYRVQWVNIGGSAGATGQAEVAAPALTKVVTGLVNNDAYNVRVQANNEAGWGPFGPEVKAQSFGKPAAVPAPTLSPRAPVPGDDQRPGVDLLAGDRPQRPAITKYDVFRRTGGGAWNLIATRSGGDSRVASDTVPYQGQTVRLRRDGDQRRSGDVRQGQLLGATRPTAIPTSRPSLAPSTPRDDKTADISYTVGSRARGGGHRVTYSTSERRPSAASAVRARVVHPDRRRASARVADDHGDPTCNSAGLLAGPPVGASISPYGPTPGRARTSACRTTTATASPSAGGPRPATVGRSPATRSTATATRPSAPARTRRPSTASATRRREPSGCAPSPRTPGPDRGRPT